jgi:hypothetical protein
MSMSKTLSIAAAAALSFLASPGVAQMLEGAGMQFAQRELRRDPDPNVQLEMRRDNYRFKKAGEDKTPRLFAGSGITQGNDVFDCTGKYVGSDPDPVVRARMLDTNAGDACK